MPSEDEVIISGIPLDVPSDNYDEFDQEIDPAKLGKKLVQQNTLKGTEREFRVTLGDLRDAPLPGYLPSHSITRSSFGSGSILPWAQPH